MITLQRYIVDILRCCVLYCLHVQVAVTNTLLLYFQAEIVQTTQTLVQLSAVPHQVRRRAVFDFCFIITYEMGEKLKGKSGNGKESERERERERERESYSHYDNLASTS